MNERSQVSKASDWLWGAVANNPEGLLLLAAGGVLLMRKSGAAGRRPRAPQSHDIHRRSGTSGSRLHEEGGSALESIAGSTSNYARAASRAASDGAAALVGQAQSTFSRGLDRALDEQPLLVALGGLAAGAAMAAILPTTNLEREALGPFGGQLSEEASRLGDQLKETASKAAGTLKTGVQEHILEPDGVKKIVSEVTEVLRDGMQGERGRQASAPNSSSRASDRGHKG
jgi:hypothetical protein